MRYHENGVAQGDPEQAHKTYQRPERHKSTGYRDGKNTPDKGEWKVDQNQREVLPMSCDYRQQNDDSDAGKRRVGKKITPGLCLRLRGAGELNVCTRRQRDFPADLRFRLGDKGSNVSPTHVGGHALNPLGSLMLHLIAA